MTFSKITSVGALSLFLVAAPAAFAHGKSHGNKEKQKHSKSTEREGRLHDADRNNDGMISRSEWKGSNKKFDRLDRNGDDMLTATEIKLGKDKTRNQNMRFRGMDRNGDGMISRSEFSGNDQAFRNHDWNGDGVLSGREVKPGESRD